MNQEAKAAKCPKWMRHKWKDVKREELPSGHIRREQVCSFCGGWRLLETKSKIVPVEKLAHDDMDFGI